MENSKATSYRLQHWQFPEQTYYKIDRSEHHFHNMLVINKGKIRDEQEPLKPGVIFILCGFVVFTTGCFMLSLALLFVIVLLLFFSFFFFFFFFSYV